MSDRFRTPGGRGRPRGCGLAPLVLFLAIGSHIAPVVDAFGIAAADCASGATFGLSACAAFAASSISTIALHPLDTVKTRIQVGVDGSNPMLGDLVYPGVAGLYRGLSLNVLKEAPDAAIFLAVSEAMSHSLALQNPWFASHVTITLLLSGAAGDAIGSIFRLPAEVLCKKAQTSVADEGWATHLADTSFESWISAWSAILYRDVPMGGLQIATFHTAR